MAGRHVCRAAMFVVICRLPASGSHSQVVSLFCSYRDVRCVFLAQVLSTRVVVDSPKHVLSTPPRQHSSNTFETDLAHARAHSHAEREKHITTFFRFEISRAPSSTLPQHQPTNPLRATTPNTKILTTYPQTISLSNTNHKEKSCLLYTSPSPRDGLLSRMPSSA